MNSILVIGSSNTDMMIKTKKLPTPGETIFGGIYMMNPAGKGANQAVAVARLGGNVTFITKRGNDLLGNQVVGLLMREGIDTRYIVKDIEHPSGISLIIVDSNGENIIVVAPGSNDNLLRKDLPEHLFELSKFDIILLQLEIPISTVEYSVVAAPENGTKVILNPSPAQKLSENLFKHTWLITPNETEAEILTGVRVHDIPSAKNAASSLQKKGVKNIIITIGAAGAYIRSDSYSGMVSGVEAKAVDTTAPADVFNGALAVALAEGKDLKDAVVFANKAASISITRLGAQASAPYRNEVL